MPNLIPPKIPDGEKVDFDVSEEEREIKAPLVAPLDAVTFGINKIFYYKSVKKSGESHVSAGHTS